ncbi:SDR family oxidoreductase [Streptomyces violaceusniger]|uniref:NAD-dependent epimerase/dehydratase n=1 Tax=Streptomyces violaceusniger (strain Tu 4113) TaxID=653045 RepID=G2NVJ7_STRV4|nr:SDR family oxidoreductase [Streptomyces violaceusniger]AEM85881.1 NAD-dependent epimerase/dehydratase [Streptomyces violaceusniger Tu 4113]
MSIIVTGASGQFGRLAVEALLRRGVAAADIVATARTVDRVKDLADRGVVVRHADLADPASLRDAFAGAEKLLLVSTTVPSERRANHRRAIDAALDAGVSLIAYTSQLRADSATTVLGTGHRQTEEDLRDSNAPAAILRNGWYLENFTDQLPVYLEHHAIVGAGGEGRASAAARADYADAAAAVLTTEGHAGAVYELGGDAAFTLSELAAAVSSATGEQVSYQDVSVAQLADIYRGAGVPGEIAEAIADADRGLSQGELYSDSDDLRRLIGRPATSLSDAIAAALKQAS